MIRESIRKGFEFAWRSPMLLGLYFSASVINGICSAFLTPNPTAAFGWFINFILFTFSLMISVFMHAGSLVYIRGKLQDGSAGFSTFISGGRRFYKSMLLLYLTIFLTFIGCVISGCLAFLPLVLLVMFAYPTILSEVLIGVGITAFTLSFLSMSFLVFSSYIIIEGNVGIFRSLRLSAILVYDHIGQVIGLLGSAIVVSLVPVVLFGVLLFLLIDRAVVIPGYFVEEAFSLLTWFTMAFISITFLTAFMHCYLQWSKEDTV